jgi:aryl-alcohol dehydrogenase-like predicted oxidoreductase
MTTAPFGSTDLRVAPLCMGLGNLGLGVKGEAAVRLISHYFEAGGNFVDTAHCYGFWADGQVGASEKELGAALRQLGGRERVVISTKGGHPGDPNGYPRPDSYLAPEVIAQDVAESLDRLGTDHIDLYLLHRDDGRVPVGEIMDALQPHVAARRVRYLGASNWRVERIAAANEYAAGRGQAGFATSQVHFALAEPEWADQPDPAMRYLTPQMQAWHAQTGMPVMAYSSSAGGFFAGRDGGYATPENLARRERARELAGQLGATPTQVALAYLRAQAFPVTPITGTLSEAHLDEAIGATQLTLSPEQVAWLRG